MASEKIGLGGGSTVRESERMPVGVNLIEGRSGIPGSGIPSN